MNSDCLSHLRDAHQKNTEAQRRRGAEENALASIIIDAAIEVHRTLGGPGLLESVYEEALYEELRLRGVAVQAQVHLPVRYKGKILRHPLRIDLLVENKIIIEVKALEHIMPVHKSQLLTYLRLMHRRLGFLLNFGREVLKDGIERVINDP